MKRTHKTEGEVEDDITESTSADIEMAIRNMKMGKLLDLEIEVCKSLGRTGVIFLLKEALNKITDEKKIPGTWRKSI